MRRLRFVGLSLTALLLLFCAPAGAARQQAEKAKLTGSRIWMVAMDGPRVAYVSAARIYVWNVRTGATSVVRGTYSNAAHTALPAELAIAGTRVAWIRHQAYGNTELGEKIFTAPVGGRVKVIGQGHVFGRETSVNGAGRWIAGVAGSGSVLAVSTWSSDRGATSNEALNLITSRGLRRIAGGPGAIVTASVDGGRIAVLRSLAAWPADDPSTPTSEPSVGVYSAGGKLLREITPDTPVPPQPPCPDCGPDPGASTMFNSVALSGNRLVVLTQTNPETAGSSAYTTKLEVYDWTTGALLQTWPIVLRPWAGNVAPPVAASGRFVAVAGRSNLLLLNRTTGREVSIPTAADACRAMALDALGLVYSAPAGAGHGKLVFVPTAKLTRRLG